MKFPNLECGKYYIKMLEAPEGYIFDEQSYEIDFIYQNEEKANITINGKLQVEVKKIDIKGVINWNDASNK